MKTKNETQRKAPSQVADITSKLSDSDWRDNAKVLNAFPGFRDKWISENIKTLIEQLDDQPAQNSEISAPFMLNVSLQGLVEHWVAREIRVENWTNYVDSGMADYDDDIIGDDLHFLLHDRFYKSELHLNQAVEVLGGVIRCWWHSAKGNCWNQASFRMLDERFDYLHGALEKLEEIQGRYFARQRDRHSKREDKFNGTEEMVEWCKENGFNVDSLESHDCTILRMLFGLRDIVKGISEDDYDDIEDDSTEAHDEILVHCGFLCESPESLLFRRRVIEEANGFYKNYAEYTHDNAIYRLNVIEEYQAFSNINNKAA